MADKACGTSRRLRRSLFDRYKAISRQISLEKWVFPRPVRFC